MEKLTYSTDDFVPGAMWDDPESAWLSKFDLHLQSKWSSAMSNGYFRYQLKIQRRIIPGDKRFILQLNPARYHERRTPQKIESLQVPFNPDKFNFTKIKDEEILFELCPAHPYEIEDGRLPKDAERRHVVIINVSPLEFGHILLVPDVNAEIPQRMTTTALQMSLEFMSLSSHPGLRIGFNGLCALASVNHQHVHAWYLNHNLYTEDVAGTELCAGCYETQETFIKGFIFQLDDASNIKQLARKIFKVTNYMQQHEIAHNVYYTRGKPLGSNHHKKNQRSVIRIYVWPRKKFMGIKTEDATPPFFVAVAEIAGQLPCYTQEGFDHLSQEDVMSTIKEWSHLPEEEYQNIKDNVIQLLSSQ